jgi:phage baseplate assembly protein W
MVAMGHSMPRIRLGIVTIRATSVGEVRLAVEEVTQGLRAGMWITAAAILDRMELLVE